MSSPFASVPTISVVIPSRLQEFAFKGGLYLERAIRSVLLQTVDPVEIVVALDDGCVLPESIGKLATTSMPIRYTTWGGRGHAGATNAAVRSAAGMFIAILEDDDEWLPRRLEVCVQAIDLGAQFVSCSQDEFNDYDGSFIRVNSFATPSGWFIRRLTWLGLGGFNDKYRVHQDNEFLGKVVRAGMPRIHIAQLGATPLVDEWLANVEKTGHARIMSYEDKACLVRRNVRPDSVLSMAGDRSQLEYAALQVEYGCIPW